MYRKNWFPIGLEKFVFCCQQQNSVLHEINNFRIRQTFPPKL